MPPASEGNIDERAHARQSLSSAAERAFAKVSRDTHQLQHQGAEPEPLAKVTADANAAIRAHLASGPGRGTEAAIREAAAAMPAAFERERWREPPAAGNGRRRQRRGRRGQATGNARALAPKPYSL